MKYAKLSRGSVPSASPAMNGWTRMASYVGSAASHSRWVKGSVVVTGSLSISVAGGARRRAAARGGCRLATQGMKRRGGGGSRVSSDDSGHETTPHGPWAPPSSRLTLARAGRTTHLIDRHSRREQLQQHRDG